MSDSSENREPEIPEDRDAATEAGHPEFYIIVAPGLEELAEREIKTWRPELEIAVARGGLTVRLPLSEGYALNRILKIPSRILVRLSVFSCRDFPKLFKKIAAFSWHEWVSDQTKLTFQASSHASRLFVKKRIESTCDEGREKYLKSRGKPLPGEGAPELQVLVRLQDDVCTLSLDTSGELLHKRGTRPFSSEAPLRETIAAALLELMFVSAEANGEDLSANSIELVDPMMGGGTFFLEAAGLRKSLHGRSYAYESFTERSEALSEGIPEFSAVDPFASFVGFEIDTKAVRAAEHNWKLIEDAHPLQVIEGDFFTASALPAGKRRWLIVNPPYGERLKIEGPIRDYYEELFKACEIVVRPERACFLLPKTAKPESLKAPPAWRKSALLEFSNGGLPVVALVFDRK